jgi:hypothetical protein
MSHEIIQDFYCSYFASYLSCCRNSKIFYSGTTKIKQKQKWASFLNLTLYDCALEILFHNVFFTLNIIVSKSAICYHTGHGDKVTDVSLNPSLSQDRYNTLYDDKNRLRKPTDHHDTVLFRPFPRFTGHFSIPPKTSPICKSR